MRKIAYCIFSPKIHGAEKRVFKLALSGFFLNNNEIESLLIVNENLFTSAENDSELTKLIVQNKNRIHILKEIYCSSVTLRNVVLLFKLFKIFSREKVDYIHAYLGARNLAMMFALWGKRIVYEITSPDIADEFVHFFERRKILFKKLHKINCVSKSVYSHLLMGLPKNMDLKNITYISTPYISIHQLCENNIKFKENTVIYATRFIERKNVLLFAEIIKELIPDFPQWNFKILGTGPLESKLKEFLSNEIKSGAVVVGYSTEIIRDFQKSKIVASFIQPDNYPSQTLFEAMACGNTLIVSNTGKSKIYVEGNNGILSENYKEDLIKLLSCDKETLDNYCLNSIDYYKTRFTGEKYFKELLKLYE